MADWYRRTTWTAAGEAEFFAKFDRARRPNRPQYLCLQAYALAGTSDIVLLDVAESLIAKLFADYPDDNFNRSSGLQLLGNIYEKQQQYDIAIEYYKRAVEFERQYPQVQGYAFLELSKLVVKLDKRQFFDFAEEVLVERVEKYPFPNYKYWIYSLLSIINRISGSPEPAAQLAELADHYASMTTSGMRYHQQVGVVEERVPWLDEMVKRGD